MIIYAIMDNSGTIVKVGQTIKYPQRPIDQLGEGWVSYKMLEELPYNTPKRLVDETEYRYQKEHNVVDSYRKTLNLLEGSNAAGAYKSKDFNHLNKCFKNGPIRAIKETGEEVILRCNGDLMLHGINPAYVTRYLNGRIRRHKEWVHFEPLRG